MLNDTTKNPYRIDLSNKKPEQVVAHLEAMIALRIFLFTNNISHNFSVKKQNLEIAKS